MKQKFLLTAAVALCALMAAAQDFGSQMGVTATQTAGDAMQKMYQVYRGVPAAGASYLALEVGASIAHGEYVRLHANIGQKSGFTVFGGVGADWLFKGKNSFEWRTNESGEYRKYRLLWHAGLGYSYYHEEEFGHYNCHQMMFNILYGNVARIDGGALLAEVGYIFWPGFANNRLGFRFSAGYGMAVKSDYINDDKIHSVWDVCLGVRFKLFTNGQTKPKYTYQNNYQNNGYYNY